MKNSLITLGVMAGLTLSSAAEAKTVTLTTTLSNYGGNGAYLAIYLTDQQGKLHSIRCIWQHRRPSITSTSAVGPVARPQRAARSTASPARVSAAAAH